MRKNRKFYRKVKSTVPLNPDKPKDNSDSIACNSKMFGKENVTEALLSNEEKILEDSLSNDAIDKSKLLTKEKGDKDKANGVNKKSGKKRDSSKGEDDTDSEEERWLDAIESGKLEEVDDELKRMKNPHLMTARQRAMMEKRLDVTEDYFSAIPAEPLVALPSGFKEKVVTEEMLAKKAIKTKRRREQAQEKREEEKKKTVDRLLKKQDSKINKAKQKIMKKDLSFVTYISGQKGTYISFPSNMQSSMPPFPERKVPKMVMCDVRGCCEPRKYSCSKTGISLCSLKCYKTNLERSSLGRSASAVK